MRRRYITVTMIIFFVAIVTANGFINTKKPDRIKSQKGFVVVELFTSEGCSSCPPADETVARLLSKNIDNVYILAYHVDYWNRLGWKDAFSSAAFSERQSQYASVFNNSSVYTPQVVVNGISEFVGSDEEKLNATVENYLHKEATQHLSINATRVSNEVVINYNSDSNDEVLLNIALVQPKASTSVKRGENEGRTLHHVNIVRVLKTVDSNGKGSVTLEAPDELTGIPLQIIAYIQDKKSMEILAADQKSL